ncbi:MAG: CcdB family protein [Burkholderiaceae bacterium]|nr:CcdB family protein [Burkholderiaceae bacterium]
MAHFDVYANPDRSERKHTPFVLDLQNTFLDMLDTFVAVPLRTVAFMPVRIGQIHPVVNVASQEVVIDTPMMATFPKRGLGQPVANLRDSRFEIQAALDALLGEY